MLLRLLKNFFEVFALAILLAAGTMVFAGDTKAASIPSIDLMM